MKRKRLTLKPVIGEHASEMFTLLADPALYYFTGGQPPRNIESVRRWFSNLESRKSPDGKEHWLTWIVQHKGQNAGIGYVQATIVGSEADIAWLIGTHWQGRGYAKEAVALLMSRLTEYPLTRLTAHIHPEHIASQQVATGLGLTRTDDIHAGEEVWAVSLTTPCAS